MEQNTRAKFLKSLLIGAGSVPLLIEACSKSSNSNAGSSSTTSTTDSTYTGTTNTSCSASPSETAGPYPYDLSTKSAIFRTDITEGKTGIPLALTLTIVNSNNNAVHVHYVGKHHASVFSD